MQNKIWGTPLHSEEFPLKHEFLTNWIDLTQCYYILGAIGYFYRGKIVVIVSPEDFVSNVSKKNYVIKKDKNINFSKIGDNILEPLII